MKQPTVAVGMTWTCLCLMIFSTLAPAAFAQYVDTPECLEQTFDALAHEKRLERSVLFGQKKSEDLPIGSVRHDKEGNTWLKKKTNEWRSLDEGFTGTTWSDTLMNQQADVKPRRGILEIRKSPASDLIPEITQTFRAYQCRLNAVCMAALRSQTADSGDVTVEVTPDGCIELEMNILTKCKNNLQESAGSQTCPDIVRGMLDEESQLLILLTAYDASYRSLLQFEGAFEGFLDDFRFPLIEPLWQMVRVIGGFARLPCFLSQCDE
jgi:hypothetical protein